MRKTSTNNPREVGPGLSVLAVSARGVPAETSSRRGLGAGPEGGRGGPAEGAEGGGHVRSEKGKTKRAEACG